ncbi:hypothetical protein V495_07145 [Pseudogymnoascus sp. VKM F-4514 (FW-929)]|nr:hypothetical protein V495_07145 [Pseudogymnoascus sp. VKM F-4514 (FW-929)]KFY53825.1 hypothetical protein V497_08222 [Pseudogymnoascus sp. VKM F-4516 (FW-969)]
MPQGLPVLPNSFQRLSLEPLPSSSPFFQKLPLEIHRKIYLAAFGNRTLHVDLQYRKPYVPGPWHALLSKKPDDYVESAPESWRWWSCVCHRNTLCTNQLYNDTCTCGAGYCIGREGRVVRDETNLRLECFVGVMGWFTSCRQAFIEAVDVLYSTNTMFIHSVTLSTYISRLLPPHNLAKITSLEFLWEISPQIWTSFDIGDTDQPWHSEPILYKRWQVYRKLMSHINPSTFPVLQRLIIEMVHYGDGHLWFPTEIASVTPANPSSVVLLEPTDHIVREFGGRLQEFEITLPHGRFDDLENKLKNVQVTHGGSSHWNNWRKFWRRLPELLQTSQGPVRSEELGYWILQAPKMVADYPTTCFGTRMPD